MFRFLNKIIRDNPLKRTLRSARGQVAVILILVMAAMLVFYAVSLNFGKFSRDRALITTASNTGAAMLASDVASYGQYLSMTYLRGSNRLCFKGSLLGALISIVIGIIAVIVTWGQAWYVMALAIAGLAMQMASFAMQAFIIQPGLSDSWNRIGESILSTRNQYTEQAISSSLAKAVTDSVQVPDVADEDGDRIWVDNPNNLPWADTVSRYGTYYSKRLRDAQNPLMDQIAAFLRALDEFVKGEPCAGQSPCPVECSDCSDISTERFGWALHDHTPPEACGGRAECNPCCLPASVEFGERLVTPDECSDEARQMGWMRYAQSDTCGEIDLRPEVCGDGTNWSVDCGNTSPYGASYPWVYDYAYENPDNRFLSFREILGRDDEHQLFTKDPLNPNAPQAQTLAGLPAVPATDFYLEDATNYYVSPAFDPGTDNRAGIYPFFHKTAEWGIDLSAVGNDFAARPRECHWCDARDTANCIPCGDNGPHPHPPEIPQLVLPLDPADAATNGLTYNLSYFVDGLDPSAPASSDPPLAVDKVAYPVNILADETVCAQSALYPTPVTDDGFWRPGADRFCKAPDTDPDGATTWPYDVECPKTTPGACGTDDDGNPLDCVCGEAAGNEPLFPDDALDDMIYESGEFIKWAEDTLEEGNADLRKFSANFPDWYPKAARWIELLSPPATTRSSPPCFLCDRADTEERRLLDDPPEGLLHVWLKEMTEMRDRIWGWIVNHNAVSDVDEGYGGNTCTEVWCVPGAGLACPEVQPDERATFDFNGNGVAGDIQDIVACLNHNVTTGGGNAARFQACYDACSACQTDDNECSADINDVCGGTPGTYLPRSLVPGFDPTGDFVPVSDISALLACPALCQGGVDSCQTGYNGEVLTCDGDRAACYTAGTTAYDTCILAGVTAYDACIAASLLNYNACFAACAGDTVCETACLTQQTADNAACLAQQTLDNDACLGQRDLDNIACDDAWALCEGAASSTRTDCENVLFCEGFNCPDGILGGDTTAYQDALLSGKGSCGDAGPDTYLDLLARSIPEAVNQVAKFAKRREFLENRVTEASEIVAHLDGAIQKFTEFLTGPAATLIQARIDYDPNEHGLPYHAIYGWQDEAAPGEDRGRWHIVKVEARIPGNCDDACGVDQTRGSDPPWPTITRRKSGSWLRKKVCYYLVNTEGVTKFRTIRYDEGRESGLLRFPDGTPIWSFRTVHPQRPQGIGFDPGSLGGQCKPRNYEGTPTISVLGDGSPTNVFDGAFMLTRLRTGANSNEACWYAAHTLLTRGMVDETCAQYGWFGNRMDLRFVPCHRQGF